MNTIDFLFISLLTYLKTRCAAQFQFFGGFPFNSAPQQSPQFQQSSQGFPSINGFNYGAFPNSFSSMNPQIENHNNFPDTIFPNDAHHPFRPSYVQPQYSSNQGSRPQQIPNNSPPRIPMQQPSTNLYQNPNQQKPQNPSQRGSRVSLTKCNEYSYVVKETSSFGSLSIHGGIQNVDAENCVASTGLVVGGKNASKGEFPHMAAIGYPEGFDGNVAYRCGGSLISERYVLTAAHCQVAGRVRPTVVRLGDLNLKLREPDLPETDVLISQFIPHENYNPKTKHNDIAVIQLDRNIDFSKRLRPACLAQPGTSQKSKATATGWGFLEYGGSTSDVLQKVELNIYPNSNCIEVYGNQNDINNQQMCAGDPDAGKDTCGGDSGGPLQVISDTNKCMFVIIGVTSYGNSYCGHTPGIYTRVSSYLDWIERKVWER